MLDPYELMRQNGVSLREKAIDSRQKGRLSTTPIGARMLREGSALVLKSLRKWVNTIRRTRRGPKGHSPRVLQLFEAVGLERAVAITLQTLIDKTSSSSSQDCTVGSLRTILGRGLEVEAEWARFRQVDGVGFSYTSKDYQRAHGAQKARLHRKMQERLTEIEGMLDWDAQDRALLASVLIEHAVTASGLFVEKKEQLPGKKLRNIIALHPAMQSWIADGEDLLGVLPRYMPITEKPLPWGKGLQGGFDAEFVAPVPFMSGRSAAQKRALEESDCAAVYTAVNALQETRWSVNQHALDLLRHSVDCGWSECGVPADPGEPPASPDTEFDKKAPEWIEYFRRKRAWHIASSDFHAAAGGVGRSLAIASEYRDLPQFYMVHTVDFRGRCYPVGADLGYQGADYQRALAQFAEARPVGEGLDWFLVTGANLFGEDKCSLDERIAWVRANSEELIACGQDPTRHRIWMEADKPFQFAAWTAEYAKLQHEGDAFRSRLPIGMDGSNNGLQIYSLLLRDSVGGKATNCLPGERPNDIYQIVADRATEIIRHELKHSDEPKQRRWCRQLLDFCKSQGHEGLPRKAAKRPTMVLPYGGTLYSCQGYLSEWYTDIVRGKNLPEDEHPFPQRDVFQALNYLGGLLWQALGDVVVKAREAMDWMHAVSDIVSEANQHVRWTTPMGLRCHQSYLKGRVKRVKLMSGAKLDIAVWEATDKVDPRRSRNGFAPNFVHSLDASAMMHTTNLLKSQGVNDFRMIHDDYAVHAEHAVTLFKTLRYAFVDIFRHDLLSALRNELQEQLPEAEIPPPPIEGDLELDKLLTSNYFFA